MGKKFKFRSLISLKPFGEALLTDKAASWVRTVRALVLVMAAAESLSWGYIGSTFFVGNLGFVSAGVLGAFVLLLILATDVTLMTLDRSNPSYASVMYEEEKGRLARWKDGGGVLLRVGLVCGSLLITAPFVAQMIFSRDISQQIESENKASVAKTRGEIEGRHDHAIGDLEGKIGRERELLPKEVGGRPGSISGRPGVGPTAKAIQANIDAYEGRLRELREAKGKELGEFDAALARRDIDLLRDRWALTLVDGSPVTRGKMLERIEATPAYRRTETAIQALLAFLFLSLLILKLYQPRAVRIYLSEALQDEWLRYRAGAFDSWLEPGDRSAATPPAMTPFTFEDVMLHVFPLKRKRYLLESEESEARKTAFDDGKELGQIREDLKREVEGELSAVRAELAAVESDLAGVSTAYDAAATECDELKASFEKHSRDLEEFERIFMKDGGAPGAPVSPRMKSVLERLAASADRAQELRDEARGGAARAEKGRVKLEARLKELRDARVALLERVAAAKDNLTEAQDGINEILLRRVSDIRERTAKGRPGRAHGLREVPSEAKTAS